MQLHSRALRNFDMIRRCGSIREAARHLHLSSSALNRQLLQLEAELGGPLFERLTHGLKLTPMGEVVARHVINVLHEGERMDGELAALKGLQRGRLDVVSVAALTTAVLPEVLQTMQSRYPSIKVNVHIASSDVAAARVAEGDADVALAFVRRKSAALRQLAVGAFPLGAVVPAGHALAARRQVSFAECARFPLVLPSPDLSFHADLSALMANHKRSVTVQLETASLELMKGLALRGLGVAFLNRFGIERELAEGTLVHIPMKPAIDCHLGVYVRVERTLPPALDAFARVVAQSLDDRGNDST
jgi:DNA-binding transcriptional LysR family regulator